MATGFDFLKRSPAGTLSQLPQDERDRIARNAEAARLRLDERHRDDKLAI